MVFSSVPQPRDTYLLWKRFSFPSKNGPKSAFAVPTWVAKQLNSAYSVMLGMLMAQVWTIIIAIVLYYLLKWRRKKKGESKSFPPLVPVLWNNRGELLGSFMETFKCTQEKTERIRIWMVGILFLVLVAYIGQTALSIIVPPLIILNNTAPVNPNAVYVPPVKHDNPSTAALYFLEVPAALRAIGSTGSAKELLDQRVTITPTETLGKTSDGESIIGISYSYNVTGVDFGLQKYPELTLSVSGSCVTDYSPFNKTTISTPYVVDWYTIYNKTESASLFDGREPVAYFFPGPHLIKGALETSNATWTVLASSTQRSSFTAGTDPWYLTETIPNANTDTAYRVRSARPVLSCWEDNVWSYKGHNSTFSELNSTLLPGLELSQGVQLIFSTHLYQPMILTVGSHLGPSALLSTTTAISQIFDAGTSSIRNDLSRLVQAAFIATSNVMTDTTLYPSNSDQTLENMVIGLIGVDDFVVWSPDASALSMTVLITIPSLLVGVWLLATLLLFLTPVKSINNLDSGLMFTAIKQENPDFDPVHNKPRATLQEISNDIDVEKGSQSTGDNKKGPAQTTAAVITSIDAENDHNEEVKN
ncbi:hypothetical protein TRIATDRAFT_321268 [Trichoderma atroviride IMI 206040]|uniref:Uncharacterized protein n=1 Tax=Hypocrea atroviridis (strain ATCC 20476 / IMI 206040) TaxID=452589 RepID=G9P8R3_HYPAI|nr:uncharacterized protein TRIATDRAFT_321268 [Trichoderma atroviride IMI 206040]EHK40997.1 hypothetical protein TRIATDRAFT_321268 [Trichoderma atroviride IMI 206040]